MRGSGDDEALEQLLRELARSSKVMSSSESRAVRIIVPCIEKTPCCRKGAE